MKKAVILHGTHGTSQDNWIPWLKQQLEEAGWNVWAPSLPGADNPNTEIYNKFILKNLPWPLDSETILIGHSSGAVSILKLLQDLPAGVKVSKCYLIGSFKDDLGWEELKMLFQEPFEFSKIKTHAQNFIFIHSDDDPHCPLEHAQFLGQKLSGQLLVQKGQKHFSISTAGEKYKQFPFLLELIQKDTSDVN